ncbi:hypothetical protein [Halorussus marinus]|uniref:hypothetical protein n=1 Tax=Halorussus marinus TaxID=2505976 RepID=UPI00106EF29C|nr:hypothetical protein [Halorussus marinus]
MESRNAVGIAPLLTGLALLGTTGESALDALGTGVGSVADLAALAGAVGSLAAIAVGAGILLGWRSFGTDGDREPRRDGANARLVALAAVAFALGVAGAML